MVFKWSRLSLFTLICLETVVDAKQLLRETSAFAEREFDQIDVFRSARSRERINLSVPGEHTHYSCIVMCYFYRFCLLGCLVRKVQNGAVPAIRHPTTMIWAVKWKWICAVVITITAITFRQANPSTIWRTMTILRCCIVIVTKNSTSACTISIRRCQIALEKCILRCGIGAIAMIIRLSSVLNMIRPFLFDVAYATLQMNRWRWDINGSICLCIMANRCGPPNWTIFTKWTIAMRLVNKNGLFL